MAPKRKVTTQTKKAALVNDIPSSEGEMGIVNSGPGEMVIGTSASAVSHSLSCGNPRREALLQGVRQLEALTGQTSELIDLLGLCTSIDNESTGGGVSSVLVTGPSGSGKTAVVTSLLETEELALFIDCRSANVYHSILRKLALKLAIDSKIRNKFIPTSSWNFWQTASWAEVRSPVAFRDKLHTLLKFSRNKRIFVVLDHADYIDARTFASLQTFARPEFVLIYVTNRVLDPEPPCDATVCFPALGLKEALQMLRRELGASETPGISGLLDAYVAAWVPHMRQDFKNDEEDLKRQAKRIWKLAERKFAGNPSLSGDALKAELNGLLSRELRFEARAAQEATEEGERICPVQSLSPLAARAVIAAFAAAHNPATSDAKIFVPRKTKAATKRGVAAYKDTRAEAVEISCRAPEPFPYNRLLAILEYINEGELSQDAELLVTLKALCDQGLLVQCCSASATSAGAWLDGHLRFACHASHEFVGELARRHQVSLREIIY